MFAMFNSNFLFALEKTDIYSGDSKLAYFNLLTEWNKLMWNLTLFSRVNYFDINYSVMTLIKHESDITKKFILNLNQSLKYILFLLI